MLTLYTKFLSDTPSVTITALNDNNDTIAVNSGHTLTLTSTNVLANRYQLAFYNNPFGGFPQGSTNLAGASNFIYMGLNFVLDPSISTSENADFTLIAPINDTAPDNLTIFLYNNSADFTTTYTFPPNTGSLGF